MLGFEPELIRERKRVADIMINWFLDKLCLGWALSCMEGTKQPKYQMIDEAEIGARKFTGLKIRLEVHRAENGLEVHRAKNGTGSSQG